MAPPQNAGYSGTPLAKKLGLPAGGEVLAINAPEHYQDWLAPLPAELRFVDSVSARTDVTHLFTASRQELAEQLDYLRHRIRPDAAIWVSWPKKAAKVPTDITEDVIRAVCLPLGYVDIKVCAVSEVWSGLKLVIRKELRD
ncbi:hypothetical protein [Chitinimonas sp.]|uniref:hypothetical protein n=1 Tax=Chitinimonas sp. TaxID=1934313 RepID=UPI002F922694